MPENLPALMNDNSHHGPSDPGIALVLGSAFLGIYAHGGFLCGLNEMGIFPGHVAGASAGAMAGGFYAAGLRGKELEEAVLSGDLKRSYPDLGMIFRGAPMFFIGRLTGLMNGKKVIRHLKGVLPVRNIEETPDVKLSLAVTDFRKKQGLFLTCGPLAESMMASCSVPVMFTSQTIGGVEYYDGGILHELPIEPFLNDPAIHTIIVHNLRTTVHSGRKKLGVSAPFADGHKMLNRELFRFRRTEAERNGKKVIVIETDHPSPGLFQSSELKKIYFNKGHVAGKSVDLFLQK